MSKIFGVVFETKDNAFETALNDERVEGFLIRKGPTKHEFGIWKLSYKLDPPFVDRIDLDENTKKDLLNRSYIGQYEGQSDGKTYKILKDEIVLGSVKSPYDMGYEIEYFQKSLDFALFGRKNLKLLLNNSTDGKLIISGSQITYGISQSSKTHGNTFSTFKAETNKPYGDLTWQVEIGLPCPTLWGGQYSQDLLDILGGTLPFIGPSKEFPKEDIEEGKYKILKDITDELKKLQ